MLESPRNRTAQTKSLQATGVSGDSRWLSRQKVVVYHKAEHVDPLTRCVSQSAAWLREAANPDNSHISCLIGRHFLIVSIQVFLDSYLLGLGWATSVSDGWWSAASATDWLI